MATFDSTRGLRIEPDGDYEDMTGVVYRGAPEAFLGAGMLSRSEVPGNPECPRVRVYRGERAGRDFTASIGTRSRQIALRFHPTMEERRRAEEEYQRRKAKREAQQRLETAQEEERKSLARLPGAADDFRALAIGFLGARLSGHREILEGLGAGYQFTRDALDAFCDAVSDAIDDLEAAPIVFREGVRRAYIAKCKQRTVESDPGFRAHMASIVAGATGASAD